MLFCFVIPFVVVVIVVVVVVVVFIVVVVVVDFVNDGGNWVCDVIALLPSLAMMMPWLWQ